MIEIFKKYSNFERTASRSEYWGVLLSVMALSFIGIIIGTAFMAMGSLAVIPGVLVILAVAVLATWVDVATIVARCRDAGINPWFTLACFIPYIGWIVMIVIGCLETRKE